MTPPPALADLFARHVRQLSMDRTDGYTAWPESEVEAYDAVPLQAIEPRQAWAAAQDAVALCGHAPAGPIPTPPGWTALLAAQPAAAAVPLAAGCYPQMLRDWAGLTRSLTAPPPPPTVVPPADELFDWAERTAGRGVAAAFVAAGVLRIAGQFADAQTLIERHGSSGDAAEANERAALLWASGDRPAARALWDAAPDAPPVRFNRCMAALFLGEPPPRAMWDAAIAALPADGAWQHLARLYAALAEIGPG